MTPDHYPGQMRWFGVITQTGHSPSQRIWNACLHLTHGSRNSNWGGDALGQWQMQRWFWLCHNAKTLLRKQQQVGPLVHPPWTNTILVARAVISSQPDQHPPNCKRSVGIISDAKGEVLCLKDGAWLFGTAHPSLHWQGSIPTLQQYAIQQPRLLHKTTTENLGICQNITALGGEDPTTHARWATPVGGVCART